MGEATVEGLAGVAIAGAFGAVARPAAAAGDAPVGRRFANAPSAGWPNQPVIVSQVVNSGPGARAVGASFSTIQ